MASMWRKAMLYLGLGPDEDYDDYDVLAPNGQAGPAREPVRRAVAPPHDPEAGGTVRTLGSSVGADGSHGHGGPTTNGHGHSSGHSSGHSGARPGVERERPPVAARPRPAVVRPLTVASAKPHVVAPASFTDAQEVADEFKRNVPVIVNLQGVERDLMRRIIDFSSGLCYGLSGQMERVANHVYLLTPSDVEVSVEERRRWRERGDG
jgi:cell division inhibitor SepF